MLNTDAKYEYVKSLLVERMSKYHRESFQLQRLYSIIHETAQTESYVTFDYSEFRDMFIKECVNGKIPNRKFEIVKEGFLDFKGKVPYAKVHVTIEPKRKVKA